MNHRPGEREPIIQKMCYRCLEQQGYDPWPSGGHIHLKNREMGSISFQREVTHDSHIRNQERPFQIPYALFHRDFDVIVKLVGCKDLHGLVLKPGERDGQDVIPFAEFWYGQGGYAPFDIIDDNPCTGGF